METVSQDWKFQFMSPPDPADGSIPNTTRYTITDLDQRLNPQVFDCAMIAVIPTLFNDNTNNSYVDFTGSVAFTQMSLRQNIQVLLFTTNNCPGDAPTTNAIGHGLLFPDRLDDWVIPFASNTVDLCTNCIQMAS